jgi:NAD(P)-dependent dehydrogenase (short-subunit alcohol dehydrogenase family)
MRPVALVTGANRGIGRGIALALAARNFDVVVNDLARTDDTALTLAEVERQGGRAAFVEADISDTTAHARLVESASAAFGRLDCLVNNAGVQVKVRGDMLDVTEESFDRLLRINLRGTFFLTQAVARRMVTEQPGAHPRSIITVSSANAFVVSINRAEYCMSKSSLSMMNKLFAVRLADAGIACFEVCPGIIHTDMTKDAAERYNKLIAEGIAPVRRWGEPEDIGRAVAMLAAGELPFSTGEALHIDGGLHMRVL